MSSTTWNQQVLSILCCSLSGKGSYTSRQSGSVCTSKCTCISNNFLKYILDTQNDIVCGRRKFQFAAKGEVDPISFSIPRPPF